jgi:outer membrane biogenesis lipoprotein LolB
VAIAAAASLLAGCSGSRSAPPDAAGPDAAQSQAEAEDGVPKAAAYAGAATFGIAAGILIVTAVGSALLLGNNMSGP